MVSASRSKIAAQGLGELYLIPKIPVIPKGIPEKHEISLDS
jgi:hypothetical protein